MVDIIVDGEVLLIYVPSHFFFEKRVKACTLMLIFDLAYSCGVCCIYSCSSAPIYLQCNSFFSRLTRSILELSKYLVRSWSLLKQINWLKVLKLWKMFSLSLKSSGRKQLQRLITLLDAWWSSLVSNLLTCLLISYSSSDFLLQNCILLIAFLGNVYIDMALYLYFCRCLTSLFRNSMPWENPKQIFRSFNRVFF